jgi:PEGA domain
VLTPPVSPPGTTPRIVSHEASPASRLFVPRWIGSGGLAIIGGAFAGIVIAVLFQPTLSAAPTAGAVTITSDPPGLVLRVDGLPRGATPLAAMLPAGSHRVEIGSGDRVRLHHVRVRPGMEASLHVAWSPAPAQAEAVAPSAQPGTNGSLSPAPAACPVPDAAPPLARPRLRPGDSPPPPRAAPARALAIDSATPVLVDGQEIDHAAARARTPVRVGLELPH